MSIYQEYERIFNAKNKIKNKCVALGIADGNETIDILAELISTLKIGEDDGFDWTPVKLWDFHEALNGGTITTVWAGGRLLYRKILGIINTLLLRQPAQIANGALLLTLIT